MTSETRQYIPLTRAYLCQDCDSIGSCSTRCPACASQVLMGLAGVLDRREEVEELNLLRFSALVA
ncbi:MAG: hypothetical protein WCA89_09320 [Terracidiphilus sp.]